MNDDNRYEFGYDNRIIILKSLLERHLKDTHNPHQVGWAELLGSGEVDEKIEQSIYSIEAKFDENNQFCLYLYDYNNQLIGEPIPIAAGTVGEWRTLVGLPTENKDIRPYLYRIDLDANGLGYTLVPDFEPGEYEFKEEYNLLNMYLVGGSQGTEIYKDLENVVIKTYTNKEFETATGIVDCKECIEVKYNDQYYFYFDDPDGLTDPEWYLLTDTTDYSKLRFNLDPKKIEQDEEEILAEIVDYIEPIEGE